MCIHIYIYICTYTAPSGVAQTGRFSPEIASWLRFLQMLLRQHKYDDKERTLKKR